MTIFMDLVDSGDLHKGYGNYLYGFSQFSRLLQGLSVDCYKDYGNYLHAFSQFSKYVQGLW